MRTLTTLFLFLIAQYSYAASEKKVITSLTSEPIGVANYLQMFFGLLVVVALVFGMAWFMRRMGNLNGVTTGNLKVLGGVSVGQRERIVLVQAGNTQLLVGVAPGEIRTLHVLDEPITTQDNANQTPKNSSGFAEKLHAAIKNRSKV